MMKLENTNTPAALRNHYARKLFALADTAEKIGRDDIAYTLRFNVDMWSKTPAAFRYAMSAARASMLLELLTDPDGEAETA